MKKIKVFLAAIFALSLGLSVATFSKAKGPEVVSALTIEGEDPNEEPVSSEPSSEEQEEGEPQGSGEESPEPSETTPAEPSEEGEAKESSEEKKSEITAPTFQEIFQALKATLKDAWDDLVAHIKKWFNFN